MRNCYKILLAALLVLPIFVSCTRVLNRGEMQYDDAKRVAMREAVEYIVLRYPDASLRDIYKSCFQDYFGPAHAIADRDLARDYIVRELAEAELADTTYYEPCGWRRNYYRVNLRVVSDGLLSADELADAFYRSALDTTPIVDESWVDEWNETTQIVRKVVIDNAAQISRNSPIILNFTADSVAVAEMLSQGNYVLHHTSRYEELYHPHYRIVSRDIFNQEILPRLCDK